MLRHLARATRVGPRFSPRPVLGRGAHDHSHSHEHYDHPGEFSSRETGHHEAWRSRDWGERAFTVGIGGPVGSGKTALVLQLCRILREKRSIGVVTNDIFTREARRDVQSVGRYFIPLADQFVRLRRMPSSSNATTRYPPRESARWRPADVRMQQSARM